MTPSTPPTRYHPHANQQDWEEAQQRKLRDEAPEDTPGYYEELLRALERREEK